MNVSTNEHWEYRERQRGRIARLNEIRTDLQNVITELSRKTRDDQVPVDMRIVDIAKTEIEEFVRLLDLLVHDRIGKENPNARKAALPTAVE